MITATVVLSIGVFICAQLEIPKEGMLGTVASIFKTPSSPRGDKTEFDQKLRGRAEELHKALFEY